MFVLRIKKTEVCDAAAQALLRVMPISLFFEATLFIVIVCGFKKHIAFLFI